MATYIIAGLLTILAILAVRSYFGKILMYVIQNSWVSLMPRQRCFACGLFYGR